MFPAIDDELGASSVGANSRSAPGGGIIAPRAPELAAIGEVERSDEAIGQHVALDEDAVAVDNRRAGEAPFEAGAFRVPLVVVDDRTGPQGSQVFLPARVPFEVI